MIRRSFIAILLFACFLNQESMAATLEAKALVEKTDLFVGEPVILQIQVSGSENPEQPDLSHVKDFVVEFRGGQQNSSRSVTIINGDKITQNIREGYDFFYQVIPRREGRLIIPAIDVSADGRSTRTNPIVINVRKPVDTEDFKLRLKLSKNRCYVGEPVILTVTWYIGKDVRNYNFNLPLLEDDHFLFADTEVDTQSDKKLYRIPFGKLQVIGERGHGRIDGKDYTTITFSKVLIPTTAGNVTIEPATITCNALVGNQKPRSAFDDDFFSDFFDDDFFRRGQRGIYRNVVVPSNSLNLLISDLPEEGRPSNFAGHVGTYRIKASAVPTDVSVGDPITLTLSLSGPDYVGHVNIPDLTQQPKLARDFKIPKEGATAEVLGKTKVFTQTIRALRSDVKKIPSIELAYFDTDKHAYRIARTEPISLNVKQTRVITALDAEGITDQISLSSEIETWSKGIAFNYEDMTVIENQGFGPSPLFWLRSVLWVCLIFGPPVLYLFLFTGVNILRWRKADPMKTRAKKAFSRLSRSLKEAQGAASTAHTCDLVQDAFRHYLGDKLQMAKGALTFNDVKEKLEARGIDQQTLDQLRDLFAKCEAGQYAGNAGHSDGASLTEQGILLAKDLEKKLK